MLEINVKRLMDSLTAINTIGRTPSGGYTRSAGSKEYFEATAVVAQQMKEAGLDVRTDPLGNIFGRRKGLEDSLPVIMTGSHLDTVTDGGLYDGALGVHAGLECIRTLNDNGVQTVHPLELVGFNHEEGNELGGTFGSRVMMGMEDIQVPAVLRRLDAFGVSADDFPACRRSAREIRAFFELHIEQGAVLDKEGIPVGIVDGIVGITRYCITVRGEANHAGSTPMRQRKDALLAASELLCRLRELARRYPDPFVFTVGTLKVSPGAVNIVPGEVEMILEIRDLCRENMEEFVHDIRAFSKTLSPIEVHFEQIIDKPAVRMDPILMNFMEICCREAGIACRVMSSGAGHDAKVMAHYVPSAMLFVPSKNGISHNPEEFTEASDIEKGTQILLQTILSADTHFAAGEALHSDGRQ